MGSALYAKATVVNAVVSASKFLPGGTCEESEGGKWVAKALCGRPGPPSLALLGQVQRVVKAMHEKGGLECAPIPSMPTGFMRVLRSGGVVEGEEAGEGGVEVEEADEEE